MKKKLVTGALLLAFGATAITGGTLAYFTDKDYAENTMTLGNVDIKQHEEERDLVNGGLKDFTQNQKLVPAVYDESTLSKDGGIAFPNNENVALWDKTINNELDKIVSVTNVGSEDAYVRTILAFETNTVYKEGTNELYGTGDAHWEYINVNGDYTYLKDTANNFITIEIDDVKYVLGVKVYEKAISKDERTAPSLKQVFMAPTANNEVIDLFGSEYTILALSQAVQAQGFEADTENGLSAAEVALNAGFGEVTAENATKWFKEVK